MKIKKQNVGIDVSKKDLAVCLVFLYDDQNVKIKGTRKFNNSPQGFFELLKWVNSKINPELKVSFTLEPTGVYHENLAYFLNDKGQVVSIVLPNKAKKYAESLSTKSKTDKLDSKALGRMGVERNLEAWQPGSPVYRKLKALTRERNALIKYCTMINNQQEALNHAAYPNKKSITRFKELIKYIKNQIDKIETDIDLIVEGDMELKSKVLKITSIPGVGFLTAVIIIAETDGFALIKSIKQIVSYAGLDIRIRESGKWKGKAKISKKGNVNIRKALYFPAISSVNHSTTYGGFYERLLSRKGIKLVASVAVQRKLLGLIYTLWKNDTTYIENYQSSMAA